MSSWEYSELDPLAEMSRINLREVREMAALKPKQGPVGNRSIQQVRRMVCKRYTAEERIRIVMEGIRGDELVSVVCRHH